MSMPFSTMPSYSPMQMPQQPMYQYTPPTYQPQVQRPQTTSIPSGPSVRLITNESEINVSDIPMDGQVHLQSLNLAQSQANQNQYLINQLRPCPTPAYITCNPWATNGAAYNGCQNFCG